MVFRDLLERLDVRWGSVQRGDNADMWSPLEGYDAAGRARLQAFLDQVYEAFISGVARGRDLPKEKVRAVAEGRVWTGAQAHERGLVDELGGFVRALELTKEAAGIAPDQPVELRVFPEQRAPWQEVLALLGGFARPDRCGALLAAAAPARGAERPAAGDPLSPRHE